MDIDDTSGSTAGDTSDRFACDSAARILFDTSSPIFDTNIITIAIVDIEINS